MKKIILLSSISIIFISSFIFFLFYQEKIKLERFYELTREDPLFYSSFFDEEEFKKAIEKLREEENDLKKVFIKNLEDNQFKENYIPILRDYDFFPYQFLQNLIWVNQETKEFLQNPSIERGRNLLSLYDKAADSYLQDVSSKIKILEKIDVPPFIFMVDSVTSPEIIKNDYLLIKENGEKLKEEIAKRKKCLEGKEDCRKLIKNKDNSSFFALIDSGEFDLKGEKIDFIKNNFPFSLSKEIRGPYKIKSLCWQNPNSEHWIYLILYKNEEGETEILPKLANQNYYRKVFLGSDSGFYQALSTQKIEFILQPEATTYECLDLTFYPFLLTLDFFKEKMEKGLIKKGDLEKNLNYKLLIENQFGLMFPTILRTISSQLKILKLLQTVQQKPLVPVGYLFFTRSCYSIFYFPFAQSIWRIEKELKYFLPEEKKPLSPKMFFTLDELKKMGFNEEAIKKFHINQVQFLNSLIR